MKTQLQLLTQYLKNLYVMWAETENTDTTARVYQYRNSELQHANR